MSRICNHHIASCSIKELVIFYIRGNKEIGFADLMASGIRKLPEPPQTATFLTILPVNAEWRIQGTFRPVFK